MPTRKTFFLILSLVVGMVLAGSALAGTGSTTTGTTRTDDASASTSLDDDPTSTTVADRPDGAEPGADTAADDTEADPSSETTSPTFSPSDTMTPDAEDAGNRPLGQTGVEVLPGAGGPPPASVVVPFGELDDDTPIPAAYDYMAPLHAQAADFGGPTDLAVVPSCSHQCITEGLAYPRGFGAELVVETSVPTSLFMSAIADTNGDGDYDDNHFVNLPGDHTSHSWQLDHLEPGQTYYAMAAATDQYGHTAYVWGEFTTLSERNIYIELGDATVTGGPGGISDTRWYLGLNDVFNNVSPDEAPILLYNDMPRYLDVDFWMFRDWEGDLCEASLFNPNATPYGYSESACHVWNSTAVDGVDLDTIPAGQTRWTQTSTSLLLEPTAAPGEALPADYGTFDFEVPITFHVAYE